MRIIPALRRAWAAIPRYRRRKLRHLAQYSTKALLRCRAQIILNLVRGKPVRLIQEMLHCSASHVYQAAHRFLEEGEAGLADRREDNGTSKITWYYEWRLCQVVAGSPREHGFRRPRWTLALLRDVLSRETGIRLSRATLSRLLRRLGIRRGRPQPIVRRRWSRARKTRRLRAIRRLIEHLPGDEVAVWADEVDIDLNPKIGPDYMLPGTQKKVVTPGQNEKYYFAGAKDVRTRQLLWVEWPRKNSDLFILLLHQLFLTYAWAKRIHVIVDNAKIHKSQRTQLALAAMGGKVQLHFLPPYSQDENRIEQEWRLLHEEVTRNHQCETLHELLGEARAYLRKRARKLHQQYVEAMKAA
jgi:transposase